MYKIYYSFKIFLNTMNIWLISKKFFSVFLQGIYYRLDKKSFFKSFKLVVSSKRFILGMPN